MTKVKSSSLDSKPRQLRKPSWWVLDLLNKYSMLKRPDASKELEDWPQIMRAWLMQQEGYNQVHVDLPTKEEKKVFVEFGRTDIEPFCRTIRRIAAQQPAAPDPTESARDMINLHILGPKKYLERAGVSPEVASKLSSKYPAESIFWYLDKHFDLVPSNPKDFKNQFWSAAVIFMQDIVRNPKRLKICQFCNFIFFDSSSKRGNRSYCDKQNCKAQRNRVKQEKLRNKRNPDRKRRRKAPAPRTTAADWAEFNSTKKEKGEK